MEADRKCERITCVVYIIDAEPRFDFWEDTKYAVPYNCIGLALLGEHQVSECNQMFYRYVRLGPNPLQDKD